MQMSPIWVCPKCKGSLASAASDQLKCAMCSASYEVIGGIPALRIGPVPEWVDFEADLQLARELSQRDLDLHGTVRTVYSSRPGWDEQRIDFRTRQVLEAPLRLRAETTGWLQPILPDEGEFLDLGCGAGMLIAAAATRGKRGVGVDVSLAWLLVARKLISHYGGEPILAAAMAENLPLRDGELASVISLDVIEHVENVPQYLKEIGRVVQVGGSIAISTPNRFSLTAEPHVFVWGVGWLPRRWQKGFVRWRSGKSYDDTRLLSSRDLHRYFRDNGAFDFELRIPDIQPENIRKFSRTKTAVAKLYNRFASVRALRPFFLGIGPFFRVIGTKLPPFRSPIQSVAAERS